MLAINTAVNPLQAKPFADKKYAAAKTMPVAQNNAGLLIPKAENLSSKYNINFKGCRNANLEAFSTGFEKKIEKMVTPEDIRINEIIPNSEDIDVINKIFNEDNIGNVYYTGVSLNGMLHYLSIKKQIQLEGDKTAFLLDDMSIDFLKKTNIEEFLKDFDEKDMQLYYLGEDDEQFEKLSNQFKDITGIKNPEITIIQKQTNPKNINCPNKDEIKNILRALAETKLMTNQIRINL